MTDCSPPTPGTDADKPSVCPRCFGHGKITRPNGCFSSEIVDCPPCNGTGHTPAPDSVPTERELVCPNCKRPADGAAVSADGSTRCQMAFHDQPQDAPDSVSTEQEGWDAVDDAYPPERTHGPPQALPEAPVWLCPVCFKPSETHPRIPDEENRPCDCGESLAPFVRVADERPADA